VPDNDGLERRIVADVPCVSPSATSTLVHTRPDAQYCTESPLPPAATGLKPGLPAQFVPQSHASSDAGVQYAAVA
jgi:hypothetical protein